MTFLVTGTATRPCPNLGPAGLCSTKTGTLHPWRLFVSFALLTLCLSCARPAHAQYPGGGYPGGGYPGSGGWVPSDASGTPLQAGTQGTNSDGSANLMPSGKVPKKTNTYPVAADAEIWWFGAFSPNDRTTDDSGHYYYNGLFLNSTAGNTVTDNYGQGPIGFYDPINHGGDRSDATPLLPDLLGSVHAENSDTLKAYLVWTGDQAHIPPYQDVRLHTSVGATATVSFGNGGATSKMSASATGNLEADTVTATAGDAGSDSPPPDVRSVLIRATPNGNLITLSRSAGVTVDTTNGLPYAAWVPGDHDYYYSGSANGYTSANASATVTANAALDTRFADILCSTIETSFYKNGSPDAIGTPFRAPHIRTVDGAITTDSAVIWSETGQCWSPVSAGAGATAGVVPFLAGAAGFNDATYSWKHSGEGTLLDDTQNFGAPVSEGTPTSISQVGLLFLSPTTDGFPKSTSVSLTVTDADGTSATNTFGVSWHMPLEKRGDAFGETYTKHSLKTRCEGIEPDFPAVMSAEPAAEFKFAPLLDGAALLVPEGAVAKGMLELVGKIAEMFEFKYDYGGEQSQAENQGAQLSNDSTNYGDAVKEQGYIYEGDERNFPINLGPDPSNYFECRMTVMKMEHDHDKSWNADGYKINGFDGNQNHVVTSHVIDSVFSERFFHRFRDKYGRPATDDTIGEPPAP